jgi:cation transport ATPase
LVKEFDTRIGEPYPVDKGFNEEVFSGTVNQFGVFEMQATKVGEDSSLQRMLRLVELADASKTPIVRLMDCWATRIVMIALTSALLTWLITGEIIRAVTVLVVFCPCALVPETPTAYKLHFLVVFQETSISTLL